MTITRQFILTINEINEELLTHVFRQSAHQLAAEIPEGKTARMPLVRENNAEFINPCIMLGLPFILRSCVVYDYLCNKVHQIIFSLEIEY